MLRARTYIVGGLLSALMAVANVYLGLKVGLTVSASIPSAVLSMLILRAFKDSGIFEHNLVQTAASAGESLAAGFIFTVPAFLLLGFWTDVSYLSSLLIVSLGGLLGVVFSVPLRRMLVSREDLKFPEGVATAAILRTGERSGSSDSASLVLLGGVLAMLAKVAQGFLGLWQEVLETANVFWRGHLVYVGSYVSPALLGVGFIVGPGVAISMLIGGLFSWAIVLPLISSSVFETTGNFSLIDLAYGIWSNQIRYIGVGAMLVGGFWTLLSLRVGIVSGLKNALSMLSRETNKCVAKKDGSSVASDTLVDLRTGVLVGIFLGASVLSIVFLKSSIGSFALAFLTICLVLSFGFLFSVVSGYMAGLVGSSNNPVSGVTIATVLLSAGIISVFYQGLAVAGLATLFVASFVCCAAAIAGDNLQDLKAGHLLGATPWRQQIMQMVGVLAAAPVLPIALKVLHDAYSIGSKELVAPQAGLIAGIIRGVFGGSLPWSMIMLGAGFALVILVFDQVFLSKRAGYRMPVLAVAVGTYLPLPLSVVVAIGGVLSGIARNVDKGSQKSDSSIGVQRGILFASGLITGEALCGVLLAGLAVAGVSGSLGWQSNLLALIVFLGFAGLLLLVSRGLKSA